MVNGEEEGDVWRQILWVKWPQNRGSKLGIFGWKDEARLVKWRDRERERESGERRGSGWWGRGRERLLTWKKILMCQIKCSI